MHLIVREAIHDGLEGKKCLKNSSVLTDGSERDVPECGMEKQNKNCLVALAVIKI